MARTIFTGGTDSLVRIHKADDPASEPGFFDEHTDAITSLSCSVCPSHGVLIASSCRFREANHSTDATVEQPDHRVRRQYIPYILVPAKPIPGLSDARHGGTDPVGERGQEGRAGRSCQRVRVNFLTRQHGNSEHKYRLTSSDLLVKIVNVQDTSKVSFLSDNVKAVRSASWDPSGKHLVRRNSSFSYIGCPSWAKR